MEERRLRSLVKGISWRALGTGDTILISYLITGHFGQAFSIGGIELVSKFALYYFHERTWMRIPWGRQAVRAKA